MFKYCLFFFLVLTTSLSFSANKTIQYDSEKLTIRKIDSKELDKFRKDSDFQYEKKEPPVEASLWERILYIIGEFFTKLFRSRAGAYPYVRYAIAFGLLVFIIIRLMQVNFLGLFYRTKKSKSIDYQVLSEDINELNLDELIETEIANKNYQKAIRYWFLKTLKLLNDKDLIHWTIHKTNHDYYYELTKTPHSQVFLSLVSLYEYVWYGNFTIDESLFSSTASEFSTFAKQLQNIDKQ